MKDYEMKATFLKSTSYHISLTVYKLISEANTKLFCTIYPKKYLK